MMTHANSFQIYKYFICTYRQSIFSGTTTGNLRLVLVVVGKVVATLLKEVAAV